MGLELKVIGKSHDLINGGRAIRFHAIVAGKKYPAFVIRYDNSIYGFMNQCPHVPVELDWLEGLFFDASAKYLICSNHGALFSPESGKCLEGPCNGTSLKKVAVFEKEGNIFTVP